MTPPPTALTPWEQQIVEGAWASPWELRTIIRRLDAELVKMTEIATDAMKDANLSHEQITRLEAELLTAAAAWEKLAEERNAMARALEWIVELKNEAYAVEPVSREVADVVARNAGRIAATALAQVRPGEGT